MKPEKHGSEPQNEGRGQHENQRRRKQGLRLKPPTTFSPQVSGKSWRSELTFEGAKVFEGQTRETTK